MLNDNSSEIDALEVLINGLKKKQNLYQELRALCEASKKTNTTTLVFAEDAAQIIGCAPSLLAALRHRKTGPSYYKVSGKIKYNLVDLLDYIDACKNVTSPQKKSRSCV